MVIRPSQRLKEFDEVCSGEIFKRGLSTGFLDLDEYIKLAKSYLTIVTGFPGSGKSEIVDAILVNMSLMYGWKTLFFSPENHPVEQHMSKLAEKFIGKQSIHFTKEERNNAISFLDSYCTWIYPEHPTLDIIIKSAIEHKTKYGLDVLVIDPWNALDHERGGRMMHEDLGFRLSQLLKVGRDHDILVIVVAHPKVPQKDKNGCFPMPNLYDISDGAMWRNKADYGIVVHRPDMSKNELLVSIQKIKQKWMGKVGASNLQYDWRSGRFKCTSANGFYLPNEISPPF